MFNFEIPVLFLLVIVFTHAAFAQNLYDWNGDKMEEVMYDSTTSLILETRVVMRGINYGLGGEPSPRLYTSFQKIFRKDTNEIIFKSKSRIKIRGCIIIRKRMQEIELSDNDEFILTTKSKFSHKYKRNRYDNNGSLIFE